MVWVSSILRVCILVMKALVHACFFGKPNRTKARAWHVWCIKRLLLPLVKTPLKSAVLRLVSVPDIVRESTGRIILTCHTPWKKVLTAWCYTQGFGWVLAHKAKYCLEGQGFKQLRAIVKHLKNGGNVVMVVDAYNKGSNEAHTFLHQPRAVSSLPCRLVRLAGSSIQLVVPYLEGGEIRVASCLHFSNQEAMEHPHLLSTLLSEMQAQITRRPETYSVYIKTSHLAGNVFNKSQTRLLSAG